MKKQISENSSVGNRIYQTIRNNIINLNLAPGTAMSEQELSVKLGVSRTPVREAFIKLSREGLVSIVPQKGTFISKINYHLANEERFLRESVERAVLELFVKEKSEEGVYRLQRTIEKQKKASQEKDYIKFMEYDDQFHQIMYEDVDKSMSYDVIVSVGGNYRRMRYLSMLVEDVVEKNIAQHQQLLDCIIAGDEEGAKEVLRNHVRKVMTEKDDIVEKYPEYFEQTNIISDSVEIISDNNIFKEMAKNK
ncbi:MAG: GntR family transcriptional regulator [Bacillota bacterium]